MKISTIVIFAMRPDDLSRMALCSQKVLCAGITIWTKQNATVIDQLETAVSFIAYERYIHRELEDTADIMLQTLSIVAAFPSAFIMVISMDALVKALKKERDQ